MGLMPFEKRLKNNPHPSSGEGTEGVIYNQKAGYHQTQNQLPTSSWTSPAEL